ncbi:hypothetical protein GGH93_003651 [Coemansia aciculifera]|nr:hypothetical protein GGH93_003651 [Coemansia aciculifera]
MTVDNKDTMDNKDTQETKDYVVLLETRDKMEDEIQAYDKLLLESYDDIEEGREASRLWQSSAIDYLNTQGYNVPKKLEGARMSNPVCEELPMLPVTSTKTKTANLIRH